MGQMKLWSTVMAAALGLLANVGMAAPLVRGAPAIVFPKIHMLNQMEIPAGKLGITKGCRADVRQYGQRLAMDHQQADRTLTLQARRFAILLGNPRLELWERQNVVSMQNKMRQLRNIRGCAFDRQFLLAMRDAHGFAIRLVNLAIADRSSFVIRPFLRTTLRALQMHYNKAVQLLAIHHEPAELERELQ